MELHQLRYFVQVAKLESVLRAAEVLHVSQPALSKAIMKLEEELGARLFDRVGKRIYLNNKGRVFLEGVEKSLRALGETTLLLSESADSAQSSLNVGVFGPQAAAMDCVARFMQANPRVRITFEARQHSSSSHVMRDFDLVFFPADASFGELAGIPYERNRTRICVPASHPLAGAGSVDLIQFRDEPFIFVNTTAGMYERSFKMCIDSGFSPWVRAITTSGAAQMRFIQEGLGVGFVDTSRVRAGRGSTAILDLNLPLSEEALCFGCRPVRMLSSTARRFLEFTFDFFEIPYTDEALARFDAN